MNKATKTTTVRLPNDLHSKVAERARGNRRSLNAELIVLIEQALTEPQAAAPADDH